MDELLPEDLAELIKAVFKSIEEVDSKVEKSMSVMINFQSQLKNYNGSLGSLKNNISSSNAEYGRLLEQLNSNYVELKQTHVNQFEFLKEQKERFEKDFRRKMEEKQSETQKIKKRLTITFSITAGLFLLITGFVAYYAYQLKSELIHLQEQQKIYQMVSPDDFSSVVDILENRHTTDSLLHLRDSLEMKSRARQMRDSINLIYKFNE